jgi:predicted nucleic acid-binding protein
MTDQRAAGILDTSVFIASETNRQLNTSLIPEEVEVATTVITLGGIECRGAGSANGRDSRGSPSHVGCCR